MSILAQIAASLGQFTALHKEELLEQVMEKYATLLILRTIMSEVQEGNTLGIPRAHLSEVVQGFSSSFTHKGDLQIGANTVTQRRHKINVLINPDEIVGEWEGYLYDEKKSRKDMPIVKFIMNKLMGKIQEDRELQMVYKGKYVPRAGNAVPPAHESVDGFRTIINDAALAGKFATFALGAYTPETIFEYVESFLTLIPQIHRYKKLQLLMSEDNKLAYQRDKRNKNFYWAQMSDMLKVDFSQMEIISTPALAGTQKIFATVPGNMVRVIHKNQNADNIEVSTFDYSVKVMGDWHESFGMAEWDFFWSNAQTN